MLSGLVFNVQRFSLHDGPGVRSTVFMKGCPLRCAWCHNPESRSLGPRVRAPAPPLHELRALHRGRSSPTRSSRGRERRRRGRPARRARSRASASGSSRQRWSKTLLRDRIFFDESGGGVTFSGGEPLAQAAFVTEALGLLQAEGVHTALDTCGFGRWPALRDAAARANLVLYDLKLMDDDAPPGGDRRARTRSFCRTSKALAQVHPAIWVRVPVIPGVNDDEANVEATAAFVPSLPGIRQVDLLPYHATGEAKFARVRDGLRPARHAVPDAGTARVTGRALPGQGPDHDHRRPRMTARTDRLRRESLDAVPSISGERAAITTAFYREHLGRHSVPCSAR